MGNLKDNALMNLMAITALGKSTINFEVEGFIEGKAMLVKKKVEVSHYINQEIFALEMEVSNLVLESTTSATKWEFDFKGLENIENLNEKGERLLLDI